MFDFEKFKKLCSSGGGSLDITQEDDREYFISYLRENDIPASPYVCSAAPYAFWHLGSRECWGLRQVISGNCYHIADFETVAIKVDNADILNLLGV